MCRIEFFMMKNIIIVLHYSRKPRIMNRPLDGIHMSNVVIMWSLKFHFWPLTIKQKITNLLLNPETKMLIRFFT